MSSDRHDALSEYRAKRSPDRTPEPFSDADALPGDGVWGAAAVGVPRLYVMQKHAARNLHYDLRLELDGVLKSWAVPKDPSYDQKVKRAAFMTEDHPVEYATFEGVIPKDNYGAGPVIVWDTGTWVPLEDPHAGFAKGKLLFELRGHRMRGRWTLVKVKRGENEWLLIKERDALEGADRDTFTHDSILTGRTLDQLRDGDDVAAPIRAALDGLPAKRRTLHARDVKVMLAETRRDAFDDPAWVFELKYDGYRVIAGYEPAAGVVLLSRNGNDLTAAFPEVAEAAARLPFERFVIDGEVVVHDDVGLPSFQRLQQRARLRRAPDVRRAMVELPATLYVFDLLAFDDLDLRPLPLIERKRLLRMLLPSTGTLRYSDHVEGAGVAFYDVAERMQLEGIIAKRADAPYRSGRSRDWLKIRASRTDDFVIIGLKASKSARDSYGSLHISQHDGDTLKYAGSVGTGLTPKHVDELMQRVVERDTSAADGAPRAKKDMWVEPTEVVEVRYLEWTDAGQLRHPVFLRFRDDKDASSCIRQHATSPSSDDESDERTTLAEPESMPKPTSPKTDADERAVRFTNLDKVLWPEDGYTKGDLIEYYRAIAPAMLPYLRDRPVVQTRFPDGIDGKSFFQKDAPDWAPKWLRTETVWSEGSERELRYFIADDVASLGYLANSASIPLHLWSSRVTALDRPDWCSLDLDPKDAPFEHVIEVAKAAHRLCDDIGLPNYIKTSGSSGLHVLIPLGGLCTHDQAKLLGELLAREIVRALPEIATIERVVSQRAGRVYVDYLQNGHGKLLVAPYCVRPLPGAPVSAPLKWSEVKKGLDIRKHTIRTMPKRVARMKADPIAGVLTDVPDLVGALSALQERSVG